MRPRILILRAPGTNADEETARAVRSAGAEAHVIPVARLFAGRDDLFNYHGLIIPGGFSYGDRVRAGAVLAKKLLARLGRDVAEYTGQGRPVLGICNGFQVLVEMGLLPGWGGPGSVEASLAPNSSARFEARWVYLRLESGCLFTRGLERGRVLRMPVAHSEGRFLLRSGEDLARLVERGQVVLRYSKPDGRPADGEYPHNPNGSLHDIAGICNPGGNVMGLMPHPERASFAWQLPRDGERVPGEHAEGLIIFRSMVEHIVEKIM